jgi:gliding motility-associated-like protein
VTSPAEFDSEPPYVANADQNRDIAPKETVVDNATAPPSNDAQIPGNMDTPKPTAPAAAPIVDAGFSVVTANESGMLYFFIPQGDPKGRAEWDFGDGTTSDNPSPAHEYAEPGNYQVQHRIRDEKGNVLNAHTQEVKANAAPLLVLPTIFTPNGDGHNDQFDVLGASKGFEEIVRISVKTRDGRIVYEGNAPLWNGEDQSGSPLQSDNYVVEVIARSNEGKIVSKNAIVWLQRN